MKKILVSSILITVFLSGCSTIPVTFLAPPSANRLEILKKSLSSKEIASIIQNESENLAKAYLLASAAEKEGNTQLACDLFTELSENKLLAIKEAALVHRLSDCDLSKKELLATWKQTSIPS
jgi:hypothetical protein